MTDISTEFAADHRHCDHLFAAAEQSAASGDWPAADSQFDVFAGALEHHFTVEEQGLFPAFEARTGMTMGPTQVMRMEHLQMRKLLADMRDAIAKRNGDGYLGLSETLMMLMQQHNIKEEQILYRMADQALGAAGEEFVARLHREAA